MSKFIEGDWIKSIRTNTVLGSLTKTTENDPNWNPNLDYFNYELDTGYKFHSTDVDLYAKWEPDVGEYCAFWNSQSSAVVIAKFRRMDPLITGNYQIENYDTNYDFVAPLKHIDKFFKLNGERQ